MTRTWPDPYTQAEVTYKIAKALKDLSAGPGSGQGDKHGERAIEFLVDAASILARHFKDSKGTLHYPTDSGNIVMNVCKSELRKPEKQQ